MERVAAAVKLGMPAGDQLGLAWEQARGPVVVPLLRVAVLVCLGMSVMLFAERAYMGVVILLVKLFGRRPARKYKWEPIVGDDVEIGSSAYPMVLVQIPMFNEKEVYQLSIGAVCSLSWPSNRIIIQVLDDSTDLVLKDMVEKECQRWGSKGINIRYEVRGNRNGYKAGALRDGMHCSYVKHCEYVAVFDADFQPEPDFLWRTIPFLLHNPQLALVQARWTFGGFPSSLDPSHKLVSEYLVGGVVTVNSDECLMTRMQEMSLDYHFIVEQEVGSTTYAFFGFNGTAGVWRIAAIDEAGGWKSRTTVEDMDLAVRAGLKGWKFLYLNDLKVNNELPSTFKAYRYQQHRWSCGPANLFRKMAMEIVRNKKVSLWKKVYVMYSFFFVRKVVAHMVTFLFYCVVLPATVLVPEVQVPRWGAVYIPSTITLLIAVGTPRNGTSYYHEPNAALIALLSLFVFGVVGSLHLLIFWVLFENVMSLHRTKAAFIGLLEAGRVNEWVVTEKLGDAFKVKPTAKATRKSRSRFRERFHLLELLVGAYLFACGSYSMFFGEDNYFVYILLQSIAFFVAGFGYVGTFVPSS